MALSIAVPKGRLLPAVERHLSERGIDVDFGGRELVADDRNQQLRFLLVRNHDLPTYVGHGTAGLGICGGEVLAESSHRFYRLAALPFGGSRLCLAAQRGADVSLDARAGVKVATQFPALARAYFHARGIPVEVIRLNGSVELAPVLGLAPFIVDIVETGRTLAAHDLEVIDELQSIEVYLIANPAYYKVHYRAVQEFARKMQQDGSDA